MNANRVITYRILGVFALLLTGASSLAQVPVDDNGNTVGDWEDQENTAATGNEGIPLLTRQDLQDLVGPVALYPDDLLAIVLPAATYPLQIVQAERFLEDLEADPNLKPDEDWDDSIVALLNYPEVITLLNEDLDWTWQLGEAVVAQQADVVSAVEDFRNTAYAAGNLQSDGYQEVSRDEGVIEISPVSDDVIYVPYYEPESVVVYQPTPVYHYYESPRPVYYYPYPASHAFNYGYFWGVTTAFTIGWASDNLHVYHHSYAGHPYYGHHYYDYWWYRRPSIYTHNTIYYSNNVYRSSRRHAHGDYWRPSRNTRLRYRDQRITRSTEYGGQTRRYRDDRYRSTNDRSTNDRSRNDRSTNTHASNTRSSNTRNSNTRDSNTHTSNSRPPNTRASNTRPPNTQRTREVKPQRQGPVAREPIAQRPVRRSADLRPQQTRERPQQTHEARNDRRRDSGNDTRRQPRNDERQARAGQDRSQQERSNRERSSQDNRSRERSAERGNSRSREESRRSRH